MESAVPPTPRPSHATPEGLSGLESAILSDQLLGLPPLEIADKHGLSLETLLELLALPHPQAAAAQYAPLIAELRAQAAHALAIESLKETARTPRPPTPNAAAPPPPS